MTYREEIEQKAWEIYKIMVTGSTTWEHIPQKHHYQSMIERAYQAAEMFSEYRPEQKNEY